MTDAKSLYDHLNKTGSIPKERQTLLDLIAVRELVETKTVQVRWVNTRHRIADILTKAPARNVYLALIKLLVAYAQDGIACST